MARTKAPSSKKKVRSSSSAQRWVQGLQKKGRKVVFTNGCFDILHAGHVAYLEEARALGDALVVALNNDASVTRLKGPTRPVVKLQDRARVLAGLGCVDCVTWFPEDTPAKIIHKLIPKILVKGGDWSVDRIVGADTVLAHGGKVYSLSFVKGKSTTKILARSNQLSKKGGRRG